MHMRETHWFMQIECCPTDVIVWAVCLKSNEIGSIHILYEFLRPRWLQQQKLRRSACMYIGLTYGHKSIQKVQVLEDTIHLSCYNASLCQLLWL